MGLLDDIWFNPIEIEQHARRSEAQANKELKAFKRQRRGKIRKKPKTQKKIPRMSYRQYMGSAYWKARKRSYFQTHGKACAVCGKKAGTTLHHKVYDHTLYGKEPDHHLVALCGKHHYGFHEAFKTKQNMQLETQEYIITMKQLQSTDIDDLSWI